MIKLIASDMDGTLLDSRKRLPPDILPVLRALRKQGVSFVVASGRQYASLRRDLEALVGDIIFIAENGALIVENDRRLFIDPLDPAVVPLILEKTKHLSQEGIYAVVGCAHGAYVQRDASPAFIRDVQNFYQNTDVVEDLCAMPAPDDVCKIAFYEAGDAQSHALPLLRSLLPQDLAVILSDSHWVDVMKPGVDKGRALRILQQQRGLAPQDCMAFGDYLNDCALLNAVTESYAMANAHPELKKIARHTAPGNDENGVVRVLRERFAL